jgi:hypothetical protein
MWFSLIHIIIGVTSMASCGEKSQGDAESSSSMCVVENILI